MSVYTSVSRAELDHFLERYDIGEAREFTPIAAGITNTNYLLDCSDGRFVLTLYEHLGDDELHYLLGLQRHLARRGVRCARPQKDRRGDYFSPLNQRPAAICHRIDGEVLASPGLSACRQIGTELARFHEAGADFERQRSNPRGLDWMVAMRDMLTNHLDGFDLASIESSLSTAQELDLNAFPAGPIHADLFHDNALFDGEALGGIIDFDYACNDLFVLDIAVLMNDWCIDADLGLVDERVSAVLDGYAGVREMLPVEFEALPLMLELAALRFWLSRLYDQVFPLSGELTYTKSPDAFRNMHRLRQQSPFRLMR